MICPKCGYILDVFDGTCPKCKQQERVRQTASPTSRGLTSVSSLVQRGQKSAVFYLKRLSIIDLLCLSFMLLIWAQIAFHSLHPSDPVQELTQTTGFQRLKPEEQRNLLPYVSGTNEQIAVPARAALYYLLRDSHIDQSNPDTFRHFLHEEPGALRS